MTVDPVSPYSSSKVLYPGRHMTPLHFHRRRKDPGPPTDGSEGYEWRFVLPSPRGPPSGKSSGKRVAYRSGTRQTKSHR